MPEGENGILAAEHRGEKQVPSIRTTVAAISQMSTALICRGGGPACQVAREKKRLEEVLTTRAEMLANHEKACCVFRAAVFVKVVVPRPDDRSEGSAGACQVLAKMSEDTFGAR